MVIVDDSNFESEVLKAKKPVLFEFYSIGCLPCRRMEPILDELDGDGEEVIIAKGEVGSLMRTAGEYGVKASPTFMFFKNGREVGRFVGMVDIDSLRRAVADILL